MSDVHVRLRIGRELYALPVENVVEVGEVGELAAVPGAPRSVLGVGNLKGQVLPVFDFASVFGLAREGAAQRLLVAELGGRRAGFAVDEVTDVAELGAEREETELDLLSYAVLESGSLVGVVDVERVFATLAGTA